jgi:hypothetical protein
MVLKLGVADTGCLSRDPDPDFLPIPDPGSRIPDPKSSTKERGEKKICCHTFFCSRKFHKTENDLIFEMPKKNFWPSFLRIIELFTQKFVTKLLKIWVWDPGSGSSGQKGTGSQI